MTSKILFGTAGVPHSAKAGDSIAGIERIHALGLDAMELEFVRGVHMGEETALQVKKAALANNVVLSVHAPYFINLNSHDNKKLAASRQRILESAKIGFLAGAEIVAFHPGFFQGEEKKQVLEKVIAEIWNVLGEMKKHGIKIQLAPETTGKASQVGSLEETIEICEKTGIVPTIDFSHLHARENGRFKSKKDFEKAIQEIPKKFLSGLRMHVSGIRFSEKGERNHLNLDEKGNSFNYKWLLEALKENNVSGCIICESPNLEEDALLMKKYYEKL